MAGLVAMVSALAVLAVESYLAGRGAAHPHSHYHDLWEQDDTDDGQDARQGSARPASASLASRRRLGPSDITLDDMETEGLVAGVSPLPGSTPTMPPTSRPTLHADGADDSDNDSDLNLDADELDPAEIDSQARPLTGKRGANGHAKKDSVMSLNEVPTPEEQQRLFVQCLLLEAGILFHSVFIGMAISVATGPTFAAFLLAICFHQSFEGLALGSRIAAIHFPRSSLRPWLMVLAFGMTTPLGQLIGLLVHNLYDPKSQAGLLVVGFMNAISAGLLLFAGLVQLLAEDFLAEKSHETLKGRKRIYAYLSVVGGASLMAGVGALKH
jgi:solute carrier family 39 (zinc transporter), member 1/2/3